MTLFKTETQETALICLDISCRKPYICRKKYRRSTLWQNIKHFLQRECCHLQLGKC